MKILLIDDDELMRKLARLTLGRAGHVVVDASSGEAGLELARREKPDVILIDVHMPGLDGPATVARLKADPETRELKIAFLTGTSSPDELTRLMALGVVGVLTKPFDPRTLAADVARLVG